MSFVPKGKRKGSPEVVESPGGSQHIEDDVVDEEGNFIANDIGVERLVNTPRKSFRVAVAEGAVAVVKDVWRGGTPRSGRGSLGRRRTR